MKPTTLLERQHANVRQLCETLEHGSARVRESLLPQLAGDLAAHIRVVEELFYPALRVRIPQASHASCEKLPALREQLARVVGTSVDDLRFTARTSELREMLDHVARHAQTRLFPLVELSFSPGESRALAERMMLLYDASVEAGYGAISVAKPLVSAWAAPAHPASAAVRS